MYQIIEVIGIPKRLYHKIWLIMRLTTVILIACLMQVSAAGLAQKITLNQRDVPLSNVLKEIRKQSGFDVFSEGKGLPKNQKVTVVVTNASIEEALDQAFKGLGYTYKIDGKTIAIKPKEEDGFFERIIDRFQAIDVTGKIVDESGQPIAGATIKVKGTTIQTNSGSDGSFSLNNVADDATLEITYIGFQTKEVRVLKQLGTITLQVSIGKLEEVTVNAGYYSVKERELTGSISRITSKDIENQPVGNVLSTIQGRMAGVNIIQNSGVPGGGYSIQIRGVNSLRAEGNSPLYIIDGVPVSEQTPSYLAGTVLPSGSINALNALNPNDIESIEVLKDADATAIYGSRGGNGVVLVTTKKGKPGKTLFSVNTEYGRSLVASKMRMMNTEEYLSMRAEGFANDGITDYPDYAYDINSLWDRDRYTNWQKELIGGTAAYSLVQLSISGGSETTRFLVSASHREQATVFSDDFRYKTDNLNGSLSHISQDKKFQLNMSNLLSLQKNNVINEDLTRQSLLLSPNAPALYQQDGSLNWEGNTFANPVAAFKSTYFYDSKTFNTNLNAQYELLPSFSVKLNGGINYLSFSEISLRPNTMYNPAYGITSAGSMAFKGNQNRFSYLLEPQLNYKYMADGYELDVLVGATYQQTTSSALNAEGYGFQSNALITNLSAATTQVISQNNETRYNYGALFARVNYSFLQKYMLNLTGRRDGSSRFGPGSQFANFAAVGGAWLFSSEKFFKDLNWLSFGKLRGSFGSTGSDLIGDYQYLDTYSINGNQYGGISGLIPTRLYNPNFSWEKTQKLEIAMELGFFNNKLSFTAAWYRNRSGNQLVGIPLPATTGFNSITANLPAKVENRGTELELRSTPIQFGDFKWESNFNISFPVNKLISFPDLEGSTYANRYVLGAPTSIVKLYNYEGIDPSTGLYRFTDYNKDGSITSPEDNKVVENIGVKYFGGWSNQLHYRQFEFSFLFQFAKQKQWNYNSMMPTPGSMNNQPTEVLNVWSAENPGGAYMPYTSGTDAQKNLLHGYLMNSTAAVSDASYIRLKNIQLSYRIPVRRFVNNLLLYVQGQNLLTISDYFGVDPEFVQTGFLPPLKTYSFGLQLNF